MMMAAACHLHHALGAPEATLNQTAHGTVTAVMASRVTTSAVPAALEM